jgi:hypothetical protein
MTRGGPGLPKVSPGPAIPDPSTLRGRATPETAVWPFQGGRPATVFYPLGNPMTYASDKCRGNQTRWARVS